MSQIQPLNFSNKAIESLRNHQEIWRQANAHGMTLPGNMLIETYELIASMLERAQKFLLPQNADLIDLGQTDDGFGGLMRIPYDEIVLEYLWSPDNECLIDDFNQHSAPRRLVLAFTPDSAGGKELARMAGERMNCDFVLQDGIYMLSMYQLKGTDFWQLASRAAVIPFGIQLIQQKKFTPQTEVEKMMLKASLDAGQVMGNKAMAIAFETSNILPDMFQMHMMQENNDYDRTVAMVTSELGDEVTSLMKFCLTVNCKNIESSMLMAPSKLNKKRFEAGKTPLFDYHVLDIGGNQSQKQAHRNGSGGGWDARAHLRRGHLRRLDADRVVWVRPAIVNASKDGDFVQKDYRVLPMDRPRM
jgi:hypothetical protein